MKTKIFILIFLIISVKLISQSVNFQWAKNPSGKNQEIGFDVAVDISGNVYSTGVFSDTVDFDPGIGVYTLTANYSGAFILKLNANGNFVWAKSLSTIGNSCDGRSITTDASGNVYVTGTFSGIVDFDPGAATYTLNANGISDFFILKLGPAGNFVWAKQIGGAYADQSNAITIDSLKNSYTTGYFSGTADFDPNAGVYNLSGTNTNDMFILKLDSLGNFIWAKTMTGSNGSLDGYAIALDSYLNVYTVGYQVGVVDFDPGPGTYTLNATGYTIFISKLNVNGNFVWAKNISCSNIIFSQAMAVDATGNAYITGTYNLSCDFDPGAGIFNLNTYNAAYSIFILKLNSSGNFAWAKNVADASLYAYCSLTTQTSGEAYVTGYFNGPVDFDPTPATYSLTSVGGDDAFISKFDANGNFIWAKNMGGGMNDRAYSIALDAQNNIYTIGTFEGTADFDPGAGVTNLYSGGNQDIFISKLGQGITTNASENNFDNEINIYPNPATNILTVQTKDNSSINNFKIELINSLGQIILEKACDNRNTTLNIQSLNAGLYFLKIVSDNKIIATQKIIKE